MIFFVVLFFPSFISVCFEKNLIKLPYNTIDIIINYGIYCLLNNMLTIFFLILLKQITYNLEESICLYPAITVKYMLLSVVVAVFLVIIKEIIRRNVGFEVEVESKKNN